MRLTTARCYDVRGDVLNWVLEHDVPMPHTRSVTRLQCWRVWVNLLSHANQPDPRHAVGFAWHSDQTQADETGLDRRTVRACRDALHAAGLIEPTSERRQCGVRVWRVNVPYDASQRWHQLPTPTDDEPQQPGKRTSRRGSRRGSWRGSFQAPDETTAQPLPGNDLAQVVELPTPQTELNAVRRAERDAAPPLTRERARAIRQQATADERARLAGGTK